MKLCVHFDYEKNVLPGIRSGLEDSLIPKSQRALWKVNPYKINFKSVLTKVKQDDQAQADGYKMCFSVSSTSVTKTIFPVIHDMSKFPDMSLCFP